jgi:hypothetical protein
MSKPLRLIRASLPKLARWLAPLLLVTAGALPCAHAQKEAPGGAKGERMPPAPQYAVAVVCALTLLVIVCMPSRKV